MPTIGMQAGHAAGRLAQLFRARAARRGIAVGLQLLGIVHVEIEMQVHALGAGGLQPLRPLGPRPGHSVRMTGNVFEQLLFRRIEIACIDEHAA